MMPEFRRPVLELLHQPLATGEAVMARANTHSCCPVQLQLISAMTRCGKLGDPDLACSNSPEHGAKASLRGSAQT